MRLLYKSSNCFTKTANYISYCCSLFIITIHHFIANTAHPITSIQIVYKNRTMNKTLGNTYFVILFFEGDNESPTVVG